MTAGAPDNAAWLLAAALTAGFLAPVATAQERPADSSATLPSPAAPPAVRSPPARPQPQPPAEPAPPAAPLPVIHLHVDAPPPGAPKRDWVAPAITGVFSFLGALLVLLAGLGNTARTVRASVKTSEALIHQKANEAEVANIQARLSDFYGPYLQRSDENRLLIEELRSRQPNPETFRTLTALQDPQWKRRLSRVDRMLLREIVDTGEALRELIRTKTGLADPALREHFARASTHFRLLSLAHDGALGDSERFARYVYPRELDGALSAAIGHLEARARQLRAAPSVPHGPAPPLDLQPEHRLAPWPAAPPPPAVA